MSKTAPDKTAKAETQTLVYVGPALREPMPLARGAVFSGSLPALLKEAAEKNSDLAALILPLKEAGPALRQLECGQGPLVKHANAVAASAAGRK